MKKIISILATIGLIFLVLGILVVKSNTLSIIGIALILIQSLLTIYTWKDNTKSENYGAVFAIAMAFAVGILVLLGVTVFKK